MTVNPSAPLNITIRPDSPDAKAAAATQAPFWSDEGPTFKDVLDTINPLQHIPIISTIYHAFSGETPSTGSKLAGGALFGGPIGFLTSLLDSIVQSATGSDVTGNIMAAIEGKPVPALHNGTSPTTQDGQPTFLSANQRAYYNAYVRTASLT